MTSWEDEPAERRVPSRRGLTETGERVAKHFDLLQEGSVLTAWVGRVAAIYGVRPTELCLKRKELRRALFEPVAYGPLRGARKTTHAGDQRPERSYLRIGAGRAAFRHRPRIVSLTRGPSIG
jgi:hypothetical protein